MRWRRVADASNDHTRTASQSRVSERARTGGLYYDCKLPVSAFVIAADSAPTSAAASPAHRPAGEQPPPIAPDRRRSLPVAPALGEQLQQSMKVQQTLKYYR